MLLDLARARTWGHLFFSFPLSRARVRPAKLFVSGNLSLLIALQGESGPHSSPTGQFKSGKKVKSFNKVSTCRQPCQEGVEASFPFFAFLLQASDKFKFTVVVDVSLVAT